MCAKNRRDTPVRRPSTYAKPPDAIRPAQLDIYNRLHIEYLEHIGIKLVNSNTGVAVLLVAMVTPAGMTLVHQPDPTKSQHALGLAFIQELQARSTQPVALLSTRRLWPPATRRPQHGPTLPCMSKPRAGSCLRSRCAACLAYPR